MLTPNINIISKYDYDSRLNDRLWLGELDEKSLYRLMATVRNFGELAIMASAVLVDIKSVSDFISTRLCLIGDKLQTIGSVDSLVDSGGFWLPRSTNELFVQIKGQKAKVKEGYFLPADIKIDPSELNYDDLSLGGRA